MMQNHDANLTKLVKIKIRNSIINFNRSKKKMITMERHFVILIAPWNSVCTNKLCKKKISFDHSFAGSIFVP